MPVPARVLLVLLTSSLLWTFDRTVTRAQTTRVESYDLDSFLQRLDQQSQRIDQLEAENRHHSEGLSRLGQVPATGAVYRPVGGSQENDKGLGNQDVRVGTLWDAMPIWLPYSESSFRGGGAVERGELDVFLPLIWSNDSLLFADLRGSLGEYGQSRR